MRTTEFDDIWSTDDLEISKLQEGKNLAKKEEPQEVLEEIAKDQGFGRLFSLFGNREEGLRAVCGCGLADRRLGDRHAAIQLHSAAAV